MLAINRPSKVGSSQIPNNNRQQSIGNVSTSSLPIGVPGLSQTIPTLLGGNVPNVRSNRCAGKTGTPELNPLSYLCSHREPNESVAQAVCHQLFGKVDCDAAMKSLKTDPEGVCTQYGDQKKANKINKNNVIESAIKDLGKKNEEEVIKCIKTKVGEKENLLQYLETDKGKETINECKKNVDSSLTQKANQNDEVNTPSEVMHDASAPTVYVDNTPFAKSAPGITTIILSTVLGGFLIYMGTRIVVKFRN